MIRPDQSTLSMASNPPGLSCKQASEKRDGRLWLVAFHTPPSLIPECKTLHLFIPSSQPCAHVVCVKTRPDAYHNNSRAAKSEPTLPPGLHCSYHFLIHTPSHSVSTPHGQRVLLFNGNGKWRRCGGKGCSRAVEAFRSTADTCVCQRPKRRSHSCHQQVQEKVSYP